MENSCIDLLPYDQHIEIKDFALILRILLFIHLIINEICELGNKFYIDNSLHDFDPHVGDNLCQIRACHILDLYMSDDGIQEERSSYADVYLYLCMIRERVMDLLCFFQDKKKNEKNDYISLHTKMNALSNF